MADRTADELAQDYTAMGHSVSLITDVIAGNAMDEETTADKKACVSRNVEHLELMKAMKKEDGTTSIWTDESFTAIDSAVSAGKTYVG
mgnify:FL=1|tara:strand:+ start:399 stop:662 length:264 start_codon:yes stop_codon:yes gene_type:complete